MATRDLELERFARKASGYRSALRSFPAARSLELSTVVALVNGICEERGWDRRSVGVVDLMAGTGVLLKQLAGAGLKSITAIELCDEMHSSEPSAAGDWIAAETLEGGLERCRTRKPKLVVCLAGFHHLLRYVGDKVDRLASLARQHELICKTMDCLDNDGILLLVDLAEDSFFMQARDELRIVYAGIPELPAGNSSDLAERIAACRTTSELQVVLRTWRGGGMSNPSLQWFREVVDSDTVIGHKDMALCNELVSICSGSFRTRASSIRCPWVFSTREGLETFVLQKFGFHVDRAPHEVHRSKLRDDLNRILDVKETDNGMWSLDWRLGVLVIEKASVGERLTGEDELLLGIMVCLVALLVTRIALIMFVPGTFLAVAGLLTNVTWIFAGMFFAKALQVVLQRRWRLWFGNA